MTRPRRDTGRDHRALEVKIRETLGNIATGGSAEARRDLADRIAALTPEVPQTDSTEPVRADRRR